MDNYLVEQPLKQVQLESTTENGFKREVYTEIREEFEEESGIVLTLQNLKNKIKSWKQYYDRANIILTQSGFAKIYRTKSRPFINSLPSVLGDDRTDGRYSVVGMDLEGGSEGGDDHNLNESTASIHGDGTYISTSTSKRNNKKRSKSRLDKAIAASMFEIIVAFVNAMEEMIRKRQRVVSNQELITKLKSVEGLNPMIILEQ
ncbi:hypothetical protein AMTRI_Chr05g72620 [Amborella trichopoda]